MKKILAVDVHRLPTQASKVKFLYKQTPLSPIPEKELSHISQLKTSVDDMLNKMGFGPYQILCYLALGFILLTSGAEVVVLSFLVNILERDPQWMLSKVQLAGLSSSIFTGFLLGSSFSGKISDRFGRRQPLTPILLLIYIFGLLSATATRFTTLLFARTLYSVLLGLQFPMSYALLAEITPPLVRGKMLVLAGGFFSFGEIAVCLISIIYLDSPHSGNWRALLAWIAQPAIICFLLTTKIVKESPRYQFLIQRDVRQGIALLEHIARTNNYRSPHSDAAQEAQASGIASSLSEKQKNGLNLWVLQQDPKASAGTIGSIKTLWVDEYKSISFIIWCVWLGLAVVYYGVRFILPGILETLEHSPMGSQSKALVYQAFITVFSEIPSVVLGYMLVDKSGYGRKKTLMICFVLGGVICMFVSLFNGYEILLLVTVARILINTCFTILIPYTAELYPTRMRTTGIGFADAFGRVGGILMPWIALSLKEINPLAPFVGFAGFCVLAAHCCRSLPYDTAGVHLDFQEEASQYHEMVCLSPVRWR